MIFVRQQHIMTVTDSFKISNRQLLAGASLAAKFSYGNLLESHPPDFFFT